MQCLEVGTVEVVYVDYAQKGVVMKVIRGLSLLVISVALVLCSSDVYSGQSRLERYAGYKGHRPLKKVRAAIAKKVEKKRGGGGVKASSSLPQEQQVLAQLRQNVEKARQLLQSSASGPLRFRPNFIEKLQGYVQATEKQLSFYEQDPTESFPLDASKKLLIEMEKAIVREKEAAKAGFRDRMVSDIGV